jgi:hypothetical protein
MKISPYVFAFIFAFAAAGKVSAHPCEADAIARAKRLLRFHDDGSHQSADFSDGTAAKETKPVRALKGGGEFDVLEVQSSIYKANYRMRFIYMKTEGCPLVGQEILEIVGAKG